MWRGAPTIALLAISVALAWGCKEDPPPPRRSKPAARPKSRPPRKPVVPHDRDAPAPGQLVLFDDDTSLTTKVYGAGKALKIEQSDAALRGARSLKISYNEFLGQRRWAGVVFVVAGDWRKAAGDGADLSAYKRLVFFARAQRPGTRVELGVGADNEGASKDSDSLKQTVTLTNRWREHAVDISQLARGDINGLLQIGFVRRGVRPKERGWGSAVIWLDDVRFDKGGALPVK